MHFAGSMGKQEHILTLTRGIIGYESQSSLNWFGSWSPFHQGKCQDTENRRGVESLAVHQKSSSCLLMVVEKQSEEVAGLPETELSSFLPSAVWLCNSALPSEL